MSADFPTIPAPKTTSLQSVISENEEERSFPRKGASSVSLFEKLKDSFVSENADGLHKEPVVLFWQFLLPCFMMLQ